MAERSKQELRHALIPHDGTHVQLIQDPASAYYQLIRLQEIKSTEEQPLNDPDEIQNLQLDSHSIVRYDNKRFLYNEISFPLKSLHSKVKNSCESISFHDELAKDVTKSERRIYFSRFASFNKAEIPILVLGSIAAALNGLIPPLFGLLLGGVIHSLYEVPDTLKKNCNFWALVSSFLGVTAFIVTTSQMLCFSIAGGRLLKRLRVMVFKRVLHQEIGWFEKTENSSGALSARLSTDAAHVRSIVGEALSLVAQNITTIIVAIAIAFRVNWMFAILILCLLPMIGIQAFLQVKLEKGFSAKIQMMYEDASQLASDAVGSIRTIASFCAEEKIMDLYTEKCNVSLQSGMKKGILSGLGIGLTNFLMFGAYSLIFWIGVRLIRHGNTSFDKLFTVFFALLMSVIGVSHSISLAPSISKLKLSVISIFTILERRSKIDPSDTSGMVLNNVRGEIIFHSVSFKYPSRPDIQIFQDMCLSIDSGKASGTIPLLTFSETGYLQIVALVGESGSGKSTIISLLQRFYDPDSGNIFLDGVKLRSLQIKWLRQQMGLVSQEPILFADTIRSNIAYGCGKERVISDEEIISAAKSCNAHTFISMLPRGYETYVGERGMQLSGGQKQRIAIARAIIKNPKILLFDEATSALDVESEHIVQNALDNVILNRTTIIVAHRFATIQNADIIVVVKNGIIAEQGCHDELICKVDGIYASLLKLQAAS